MLPHQSLLIRFQKFFFELLHRKSIQSTYVSQIKKDNNRKIKIIVMKEGFEDAKYSCIFIWKSISMWWLDWLFFWWYNEYQSVLKIGSCIKLNFSTNREMLVCKSDYLTFLYHFFRFNLSNCNIREISLLYG